MIDLNNIDLSIVVLIFAIFLLWLLHMDRDGKDDEEWDGY